MHIPDGFLNIRILFLTNFLGLGFLAPIIHKVNKNVDSKRIPLLGIAAAFIFIAQLITFPVPGATSVHLQGAVLISVLLGPFSGTLVMAAVLFMLALLFQHGGVFSFGANFINNGLFACIFAYYFVKLFGKRFLLGCVIAGFMIPILSSLLCALELGVSGTVKLPYAFYAMGGAHFFAGIVECIVTVFVLISIKKIRPDLLELKKL